MLSLLNSVEDSEYMHRVWCGFELFVASKHRIPIEVILPESAVVEVDSLCRGGLRQIRAAICIDIANAKATSPDDEDGINKLICEQSSYEEVNRKATEALAVSLFKFMFEGNAVPHAQHELSGAGTSDSAYAASVKDLTQKLSVANARIADLEASLSQHDALREKLSEANARIADLEARPEFSHSSPFRQAQLHVASLRRFAIGTSQVAAAIRDRQQQ
eukprot:TRINITY_DN57401_c0_g1_i1.p1 TRINITY_DN57401_c0_g1~~TRINITY_DN57401_c0_g1_i1.p1  ORF type:complete len:218 (+),score=31.65 TRINITY_DN57401_c0_g1_i1:180-833(+)